MLLVRLIVHSGHTQILCPPNKEVFNSSSVLLAQRQSARLLSTVQKFQTRYLVAVGSIPTQDSFLQTNYSYETFVFFMF
jgi:hypothetical protein